MSEESSVGDAGVSGAGVSGGGVGGAGVSGGGTAGPTFHITTESGTIIDTENAQRLRTE